MKTQHSKRWIETDRHIRFTAMELAENCDRGHLTVRAICEHAGINRTTFYEHFRDIDDLFGKLEMKVRQTITEQLHLVHPDYDSFSLHTLTPFLVHIRENRRFYRTFLKSHTSNPMKVHFQWILNDEAARLYQKVNQDTTIQNRTEILYSLVFFQAGFTSLLCRWVENGCRESPEEIASIIVKCLPGEDVLAPLFKINFPAPQ